VRLIVEFKQSQGYAYDLAQLAKLVDQFLADPELGRLWLVCEPELPVGYVILCFGFSFEFGGRDAFIDELYVEPRHRGKGWGRAAVEHALQSAPDLAVRAVHLEVEPGNPAIRLYDKLGFKPSGRHLLSIRT
jgi:ribosomal protein S18 acetylase RimI-like enzyme